MEIFWCAAVLTELTYYQSLTIVIATELSVLCLWIWSLLTLWGLRKSNPGTHLKVKIMHFYSKWDSISQCIWQKSFDGGDQQLFMDESFILAETVGTGTHAPMNFIEMWSWNNWEDILQDIKKWISVRTVYKMMAVKVKRKKQQPKSRTYKY